ncbi:hypothetical protein EAE96_005597 [Botrytis aclada]|nr:hypothetical protein EAE96_005597 [Botrytis aclada]
MTNSRDEPLNTSPPTSPSRPFKRTRLMSKLERIFSGFELTVKTEHHRRFRFGTGHHYTQYNDGCEIYVNDDGIGIYVDIMGFRYRYVRDPQIQKSVIWKIERELRDASDLDHLRYAVRGFFAERVVKELRINKLRTKTPPALMT